MGFWSRVKSAVKSAVSKAKSTYKKVDRKVGGYLPGGVSPSSVKSSSTSSSSSSSSSSSGGSSSSSSGSSSSGSSGGSHNVSTQTYTDSSGNKQSMSLSNANKLGASINFSSSRSSGFKTSSSSSGGSTSNKINYSNNDSLVNTKSGMKFQSVIDAERKANAEKMKYANVMSAYKEPTKEEKEKAEEIKKKYEKKWYQKAGDKFDEYYDKTLGKEGLFGAIDYYTRDKWGKEVKSRQDKMAKEGKKIYAKPGDPGYVSQGTMILKDWRQYTDEELKNMSHGGADEIINRQVIVANKDIQNKANAMKEVAVKDIENKVQEYADARKKTYEKQYASGKISYEEANSKLNADVQKYADDYSTAWNEKLQNDIQPYVKDWNNKIEKKADKVYSDKRTRTAKAEVVQRAIGGFLIGAGIVASGPVGAVVGGISIGKAVKDSPKIVKAFKDNPVAMSYETIPVIVGGIAGAKSVNKLTGKGNVRLARKVSKMPKEIEIKGIIDYMKFMKTISISKLIKLTGGKKSIVVKGKGGSVTIQKVGKGIVKATRTGKNWKEVITMDATGKVQGVVSRVFKNWRGKEINYYIKYKISANGNRITQFYKGKKLFSTIKDQVRSEYGLTEPKNVFKSKYSKTSKLENLRVAKMKAQLEQQVQQMMNTAKGKYGLKGKAVTSSKQTDVTIADPVQFEKMMKIAKETGNKKLVALLKEVKMKRAKFGGKGTNQDLIKVNPNKYFIDDKGVVTKISSASRIRTPKINQLIKQDMVTKFSGKYTKYPSKVRVAVERLGESQAKLLNDKRGMMMFADPISGVVTKLKVPQIRIKTANLQVTKGFNNLLSLPVDLSVSQLRYLMSLGAITSLSLNKVLADIKTNVNTKMVTMDLSKIGQLQNNLQMSKVNTQLQQVPQSAVITETKTEPIQTNLKTNVPGLDLPPIQTQLPVIWSPELETDYLKKANAKPIWNKETLKQLRWVDPLYALTGKNKYSSKMNIKLTSRYGNFST